MKKITKKALIKIFKKFSRESDIQEGLNLVSYKRVHKIKKVYSRKNYKIEQDC